MVKVPGPGGGAKMVKVLELSETLPPPYVSETQHTRHNSHTATVDIIHDLYVASPSL